MSVINKIKEIIPYRIKTFLKKNFRKYQGLKQLDKKMLKYINYKEGFYIEIGAHDGIKNSNTFFYEKYKNWSGILIEPSDYFELLKKNRSKNNKFESIFNFLKEKNYNHIENLTPWDCLFKFSEKK